MFAWYHVPSKSQEQQEGTDTRIPFHIAEHAAPAAEKYASASDAMNIFFGDQGPGFNFVGCFFVCLVPRSFQIKIPFHIAENMRHRRLKSTHRHPMQSTSSSVIRDLDSISLGVLLFAWYHVPSKSQEREEGTDTRIPFHIAENMRHRRLKSTHRPSYIFRVLPASGSDVRRCSPGLENMLTRRQTSDTACRTTCSTSRQGATKEEGGRSEEGRR